MTSGPNSTDAEANTAKLIAEWQKLIEQAGEMFQKPITIDETLLKSFNISGMFQNMMTQNAMAMYVWIIYIKQIIKYLHLSRWHIILKGYFSQI